MIRRIESWSPEADAICVRDVYGTRTAGYYRTYGTEHPDVSFYAQYTRKGCSGVLSAAFGNGTLSVDEQADLSEWAEFIRFLGLETLLCPAAAAVTLCVLLHQTVRRKYRYVHRSTRRFLTARYMTFCVIAALLWAHTSHGSGISRFAVAEDRQMYLLCGNRKPCARRRFCLTAGMPSISAR